MSTWTRHPLRRRPAAFALPAVLALLALACQRPPSPAVRPQAPVVLISIDTLRSDRLPAYGYDGVATPALDALAADGIVFERAYAHVPLTLPSHASLLSGLLPTEHGVRYNVGYDLEDAAELPYLPALLNAAGHATGGFVSSFVLRRDTGLARGFEVYDDDLPRAGDELAPVAGSAIGNVQRRGADTLERARAWLATVAERPFFLFFHIYEPHSPYEPPSPFAERYGDPYDGEVAAADAVIGGLLDELRRLGVYDRALVVLLSDHGEGLFDHGEPEHGLLLYREALQVPLILKLPGGELAGSRSPVPVQLVDVVPTVLELLGRPLPQGLAGRSLLHSLAPGAPPRALYAETYVPRLHKGWSELLSVIEGDYHYIQGPDPELYDLAADPAERHNVLRRERRVLARLRAALDDVEQRFANPGAVDAETAARLAALGYATLSSPPPAAGPLPDPKAEIARLEGLWRGQHLINRGELEAAVEVLAPFVAAHPEIQEGWLSYGFALDRLGRSTAALEAFEQAARRGEVSGAVAMRLAHLYAAAGRPGDAVEVLERALASGLDRHRVLHQLARVLLDAGRPAEVVDRLAAEDGDPALLNARAAAYFQLGRLQRAADDYRRVLALQSDNPKALEGLGAVALRAGRAQEARELLRRALAQDEHLPIAWNTLGVAEHALGHLEEALAAWQRALALDAAMYDTLYNLGVTAARAGRRQLALDALRRFVAEAPPRTYGDDVRRARQLLAELETS
ncbi:MAG: tetratricopeptide repeat protein [Acidobacteria bacterium]|nr:MAG: tetratricopeptide repeat protein [Acidobacteriota bacterium]